MTPQERIEQDQRRAEFLDFLYERSGRTCQTYTGLWQQFERELAAKIRDNIDPARWAEVLG